MAWFLAVATLLGWEFDAARLDAQPPTQAPGETKQTVPSSDYQTQVRPLLAKYCIGCHGQDRQEAGLRLDTLSTKFASATVRELETWDEVSQRIKAGSMPPAKSSQPSPQETAAIVAWLKEGFEIAAEQSPEYGRIVMRRLTRYEYNYTLQDLLGVKKDFVKKIAIDFPSREGFHNNGSVLAMSSQLFKEQWAIAKIALGDAIVQGPRPEVFRTSARDDGQGTARGRPSLLTSIAPI